MQNARGFHDSSCNPFTCCESMSVRTHSSGADLLAIESIFWQFASLPRMGNTNYLIRLSAGGFHRPFLYAWQGPQSI
jgi:hypothetical protein